MGKTRLVPYLIEVKAENGKVYNHVWDEFHNGRPTKSKLAEWVKFCPYKELTVSPIIEAHAFSQRTGNIIVSYYRSEKEALEDSHKMAFEINYTVDFHLKGWRPATFTTYIRAHNEAEALAMSKMKRDNKYPDHTYTYNSVAPYCMFAII